MSSQTSPSQLFQKQTNHIFLFILRVIFTRIGVNVGHLFLAHYFST